MREATVLVSVVIPTYNRCASLRRTLDALSIQTYPLEAVEVLVVVDGCTDGTVAMLRHTDAAFALHVIEQPNQGAAAARNRGAACASGWILIFIDDDVEPTPALVEMHIRAHQSQSGRVVIGPYSPVIDGRVPFILTELRAWWERKFYAMRHPSHRFSYRDLVSGNFSIEARVFNCIGGFDSAFPDCGGEDYELGARLIKAGFSFFYADKALGYHYESSDINRSFRRARQEGRADVLISERHPELRPTLLMAHLNQNFYLPNQVLRTLAFQVPVIGDVLTRSLQRILALLEWVRLRRFWRLLCGSLRSYWYWRGVADELASRQEASNSLQSGFASCTESAPDLEIDLGQGLTFAEQCLDAERPESIRICYGQHYIGCIPRQPGVERLRAAHLRAILATDLALPLLNVLVAEKEIGFVDMESDGKELRVIPFQS